MDEIDIADSHLRTSRDCCKYCGATLSPAFYFCHTCATPYKPVEVITGQSVYQPVESERIRQKAPHVWSVFWSYVIVIFVVFLSSHILIPIEENSRIYVLLTGSALFLILTAYFAVRFRCSLQVQLKRIGLFHRTAMVSFALLPLLLGLNYFYHFVFIGSLVELEPLQTLFVEARLGFMVQLTVICILPAITEEIAFRGLIQHWLQTAITPWRAIVLTSALFTALHISVLSAPYLFLLGLLLGWAKYHTSSLYPSMLLHFLHNAAVLFVFPYIIK